VYCSCSIETGVNLFLLLLVQAGYGTVGVGTLSVQNETLSVIAMRVGNPDCSPFGINR